MPLQPCSRSLSCDIGDVCEAATADIDKAVTGPNHRPLSDSQSSVLRKLDRNLRPDNLHLTTTGHLACPMARTQASSTQTSSTHTSGIGGAKWALSGRIVYPLVRRPTS